MKNKMCAECFEPIKNERDLTRHSIRHQVGTYGLAVPVRECPFSTYGQHVPSETRKGICSACDGRI